MSRVHELKTDPAVFDHAADGHKTFEVRKDDRGFEIGDRLLLRKTRYTSAEMKAGSPLEYTGEWLDREIGYILRGSEYGIAEGVAVLGFRMRAELAKPAPVAVLDAPASRSDADKLSNIIREVDGNHSLGAGALAEAIIKRWSEWGCQPPAPVVVPEGWKDFPDHVPPPDTECLVELKIGETTIRAVDVWEMQRECPVGWSSQTVETGYGWSEHDSDDVARWLPMSAMLSYQHGEPVQTVTAENVQELAPEGWPKATPNDAALGWTLDYQFLARVTAAASQKTEYSTSMEATEQVLIAALGMLAAAPQPPPSVDVEAVRAVITDMRQYAEMEHVWAYQLARAIGDET